MTELRTFQQALGAARSVAGNSFTAWDGGGKGVKLSGRPVLNNAVNLPTPIQCPLCAI